MSDDTELMELFATLGPRAGRASDRGRSIGFSIQAGEKTYFHGSGGATAARLRVTPR